MAVHVWRCDNCDTTVEKISKHGDKLKCRKCGLEMHTLLSQTSFILSGKGWASDGYAKREE